ncbi:OmpA/MotB family protein [Salidesulfovibrio onnuriiensis]|uniref:OmpA/MotB family protein n=1 Tax=Salidesulfovibrio onnuriiensis TaxID=2583823 RepID=UPI0011C792B5|nr:flagellar motor protein MotB [Salidesulfovibrio onnuriiensis]
MAAQDKKKLEIPPPKKPPTPPPAEEGIPPWMATFADMVTLLLCFFVLLLSFTNQDITNFKIMMGSITEALGVQKEDKGALSAPYSDTRFKFEDRQAKSKEMVEIGDRLRELIRSRDLTKAARVSHEKSGVMFRVSNSALFAPGSARLGPSADKVLHGVVDSLKKTDFNLVIRGHTDGENPESGPYKSNWELSAARAAACLRWIVGHSDIPPQRMKAVGFASAKPLLPSTTEANRQANRRVDFFFVPNDNRAW